MRSRSTQPRIGVMLLCDGWPVELVEYQDREHCLVRDRAGVYCTPPTSLTVRRRESVSN